MGKMMNADIILFGKFGGRRILAGSRLRCDDNIKINLKEKCMKVCWNYLDHNVPQLQYLVNTIINHQAPQNTGNMTG
jgi:hypothetical protein